ncbi:YacL family protein [Parasalinivibrio latis]|uniref:UPF0231 family protein n=1 Tax=Parasalinivibrio latis TaxID=2952610 RepID=UPI0030E22C14
MDYEFRRNNLDDSYRAQFSMGHEALGRWLTDEVGRDKEKIQLVLGKLHEMKDQVSEWRLVGEELTLVLSDNEALVQDNRLFSEGDDDLEDDMHYYDEENIALCGFEDLIDVLEAWQAFLSKY